MSAFCAFGQLDSVLLDSTYIDLRLKSNATSITDLMPYQTESLSTTLSENASVFVKSSSGNALASLSIRGGTAEQTAVLWNGLSIQNTLNGTVDLANIPTLNFDKIILNANQSSTSGSGSIAGSLELKNGNIDTSVISNTQLTLGSFGRMNVTEQFAIAHKKSSYRIALYLNAATNDYKFIENSPIRLQHAASNRKGLMFERQQRFKKMNPWNIRIWLQQSDRQIPPTTLEGQSLKYQTDKTLRLQSDWSVQKGNNSIKLNAGSFIETLDYQDSIAKIYSSYSFVNNSVLCHFLSKQTKQIKLGADLEFRQFVGIADTFYSENRFESSEAFHVLYNAKKTRLNASVRYVQYNNTEDRPLLWSVNSTYLIKPLWSLVASVATNYRMPTFNSLYWNPGGNPNLGSERSLNSELTSRFKNKKLMATLTVYSNYIKDQIRWQPGNDGIFEAQQIIGSTQWNRGFEANMTYNVKSLKVFANFSLVRSTNENDKNQYQQTFVPFIQVTRGVQYSIKKWNFRYSDSWLGKRYTDIENTNSLPAILLHNFTIQRDVKNVNIRCTIRNIANTYYTVQPFMPNAPRNIYITLSYKIKNKKK